MNDVTIFNNDEFGTVRTVVIDDEPWFVGKDVAAALGYSDTFGALKKHVDADDKQNCQNDSFESPRGMTVINESGVYSLAFSSKLPSAKKFKRWVTSEVLPTLRKTGSYNMPKLSDMEKMAYGLIAAQKLLEEKDNTIAQQEQVIGELRPKADYTDMILQHDGLVSISQIAKDYGMSGREMNSTLHNMRIIYKCGGQWLLYSNYQAKGYTHSETVPIQYKYGRGDVKMNTKWTQKGRLFLYDALKNKGILPVIEREEK